MSSKEMKFDGNDVVSSENHNLRISMENLKLRDDCQSEQHIRGIHQVSLRGQSSQLVDGQSDQAKDVLKQLEVCAAHPEEAGSMDKRQKKMADKGRECRKGILDKKRTNLMSRIIRKSSEIDVLLYSHQNDVTVKEELAPLNNIFKLIEDINQGMIELDDNYTKELLILMILMFTDIDEKVFSFKHKFHNWLREGDEIQRIEKRSRSSCSRSTSSKLSSRSSSSKSSKLSTKERAIEEKVRLADLQAEETFMPKKRYAELQAESLRIEEEMAKAQARVNVYEEENTDQKVPLKILTMADIKAGDSRYPVVTKKRKYLDQNEKSSVATQFQARPRFNRFSTTSSQQGELQNNQHHQQDQQNSITGNQNEVTDRITKPCEKDSEIGNMLYQLVKEQSALSIDIEVFDGNPLHYTYFRSIFREAVEKRIKDPQGKLSRLINLTSGEAKELVKPFIHDRPECGFANAMRLLEKQYGNPHKLLASYRKEIKQMTKIKHGDAAAHRRLFNFLIKCQSLEYGSQNPLDTPDVICMILAKIQGYLQDRWNRNVQKIRKVQMREPGLTDLTKFFEDEMVLVNDPLFSREAVGQYEEKSLKQQSRSTKYKFQTHVIKGIGDSAKRDKARYPVCDDHHDIEECQAFLSQITEDRGKTLYMKLYMKKLCYECLGNISKEHNAKSCANRRMCKV